MAIDGADNVSGCLKRKSPKDDVLLDNRNTLSHEIYSIRSRLAKRLSSLLVVAMVCALPVALADSGARADVAIAELARVDVGSADVASFPALQNRIIGGSISGRGEFPWMVALARNDFRALTIRQFCGGSIIASRWVLTAAHCMFDVFDQPITAGSMRVIAGITNLRTQTPDEETIVVNIIVHPAYNHADQNALNDIALLELATDIPASSVPLYGGDPDQLSGLAAITMGWGATDFSNPEQPVYPHQLHDVVVPLVSRTVCNDVLSYNGAISSSQLCAGLATGGVDSCAGDSGGPLVASIDGVVQQLGIVSFGRGCAEPLFYGIYTNVPYYLTWLNNYVEVGTTPRIQNGILTGNNGYGEGDSNGTGAGTHLFWLIAAVLLLRRKQRWR